MCAYLVRSSSGFIAISILLMNIIRSARALQVSRQRRVFHPLRVRLGFGDIAYNILCRIYDFIIQVAVALIIVVIALRLLFERF